MNTHATQPQITADEISVSVEKLDVAQAAATYRQHGCLVVRGLMKQYIAEMAEDIAVTVQQSMATLDQAERRPEGWVAPNGSLFIPAPAGYGRDKQIMTVGISYFTSAAFLRAAMDPLTLDILEAILGPNIELFGSGQSLVKEPVGGHPKHPAPGFGLFRAPLRRTGGHSHLCGGHRSGQWRIARGARLPQPRAAPAH